ncbi:hypothetical protein L2729_08340 [Shewanella gelidimarina]|uniref:hypothetical protein n=1 Tax=Shewanella gelidimarina TaxID=56813 RepID=UPI00200D03B5|nr:hypothetical protein [Shewanella gelidimarina]MCL1058010.1 hypothetical protein [Shewanella gelidimarina]
MKKTIVLTLLLVSFSSSSFASCRWVNGSRYCGNNNTVVVNRHHSVVVTPGYQANPWAAFGAVVGAAIIIDAATGQPTVEGKESIVVETKLIEAGKVDVVDNGNEVVFIKGIG